MAGFVASTPGGLGVREFIIQEMLKPTLGQRRAVLAAVLLRLLWTVAELVLGAFLYWTPSRRAVVVASLVPATDHGPRTTDSPLSSPPEGAMISVVIPVYNEQDSLAAAARRDRRVAADSIGLDLEVLFVDDGSTRRLLGGHRRAGPAAPRRPRRPLPPQLRQGRRPVRRLPRRPRRRHPHARRRPAGRPARDPALPGGLTRHAGSRRTAGPAARGLDVVSGWKRVRHDPWHKVWPSRVFNGMVSWLTGVRLHDHNCGMKCYRAEVFREVRLYGELHRFIPVLAAARGFRVGEIDINHRPRRFGHSKYGVRRFVKGFLDLLTVKFLTGFGRGRSTCSAARPGLLRPGRPRPGLPGRHLAHSPVEPGSLPAAARAAGADLRPGRPAAGAQMMSIGFSPS